MFVDLWIYVQNYSLQCFLFSISIIGLQVFTKQLFQILNIFWICDLPVNASKLLLSEYIPVDIT